MNRTLKPYTITIPQWGADEPAKLGPEWQGVVFDMSISKEVFGGRHSRCPRPLHLIMPIDVAISLETIPPKQRTALRIARDHGERRAVELKWNGSHYDVAIVEDTPE